MVSHHLPTVSMFIYLHLALKSTNPMDPMGRCGHKMPRCCVRNRANKGIKQHKARTSDFPTGWKWRISFPRAPKSPVRNRWSAINKRPVAQWGPKRCWVVFFDRKETTPLIEWGQFMSESHFFPKWSTKLSGDSQPTPPPPRYLRIL